MGKHLVQQFCPVDPRFFLEVTQNCTLPIWSHPLLKPLPTATDLTEPDCPNAVAENEDNPVDNPVYDRLNLAAYAIDDDDGLINTEGGRERTEKNAVKEKWKITYTLSEIFAMASSTNSSFKILSS